MTKNKRICTADVLTKNKRICTACINDSGGCCTEVEISIHIDELAPFKERFDAGSAPAGHTLEIHDDDTKVYLYTSQEDSCMFLNEDTTCGIYEKRPLICRMYPVMWEEKKKTMNFFGDFACPLAHMIPVRDLASWSWNTKNKGYVDKMGELDFESSEPQYVNLTVITDEVDPVSLLDPEFTAQ
ncbi:MAG: YkgJ family cysteine cluster protein [Candidatus Kariarchaeaceae archaeon]